MESLLENRKRQLLEELAIAYAPKKKKWWHNGMPIYNSTSEICSKAETQIQKDCSEIICCESSKKTVYGPIIICAVSFGPILFSLINKPKGFLFILTFGILVFILSIFLIRLCFKKIQRLAIYKDGIWMDNFEEVIQWKSIVATHIKLDETDDYRTSHLVIDYYDSLYDDFKTHLFQLDYLEISIKEVCSYIEFFKAKATNFTS